MYVRSGLQEIRLRSSLLPGRQLLPAEMGLLGMKILDKNWFWQASAALMFAAIMAGLHFMITGFNGDFGAGFAIGLIVGITLALIAAGWRKGEMAREEPARLLPYSDERPMPDARPGYSRRSGASRQAD